MATKRLTGQEALDYIQKNKGNYTVVSGNVPQPKKDGGIVKFAKDIASPFTNTGKLVLEAGNLISTLPSNTTGVGYKAKYADVYKDPLGTGIKSAAGTLAFGVPAGATARTAIGYGALSGGLGGLSQSNINDPSSIIKNVGTGAVTGGVLGGVFNKLASRSKFKSGAINEVGQNIEERSLGIKPPKNVRGVQMADELRNDVGNILREKGKSMDARGIGEAYDSLRSELSKTLENSGKTINTSAILDDLNNTIVKKGVDIESKTNSNLIGALFKQVDETQGNPTKIAGLISELDNELQPAFLKIQKGSPLTQSERLTMSFRESLANQLQTQLPETAPIYKNMSLLHQAEKDAITQFNKAGTARTPAVLPGGDIPTGRLPSRLQQAVGRVLQGNFPGAGIGSNIPIGQIAQRAFTGYAPSLATQGSGGQPMQPVDTGMVNGTEQTAEPQMSYQDALRLGLMVSNGNITQGLALANFILNSQSQGAGGSGGKPTEKQMQFAGAANSAERALSLLEGGQANTGKIQALESKFSNFLGTTSPTQTDYKSQLALARGLAMNALAGANISPSEAKRVADSIPSESDEPGIAQQKLRSFIQQMRAFGTPNY